MSKAKKKGARWPAVVDLARTKAALARLDKLAARHPHLTSKEVGERLANHLDDEHAKETANDGTEEDDGGR